LAVGCWLLLLLMQYDWTWL